MPGLSEDVVRRTTRNPVTAYSPTRALVGGRTANAGTANRVAGAWQGPATSTAGPRRFNMGQGGQGMPQLPQPQMSDWLTMSEQGRAVQQIEMERANQGPGGWRGVLGHAVNNPFAKVVMGGLNLLDMPRRFTISTINEAIDAVRPGEEFDADLGDWWKQFTDPEFGFGTVFNEQIGTTGNRWVDRGIGLAGDILLDPLTYVAGSSVLSGTGRSARLGLAGEAELANLGENIVNRAGRLGASTFDDAERKLLREAGSKIKPSGYYFKLPFAPEASRLRIAGTGYLERGVSGSFARVRGRLAGGSLGRAIARGSIDEIVEPAYRRLLTGEGELSASEAAAFAAGYDEMKRASQEFVARGTQNYRALAKRHGPDVLNGLVHEAETTGGTPLNDLYSMLAELHFKATGQKLNDATFIPHILKNEALIALGKKSPLTDAIRAEFFPGLNLESRSPHLETRLLVPRGKPIKILDREMDILENSIDGVNEAWHRAFPEFDFDLLETKVDAITKRYIDSMAQSVGKASMVRKITESQSRHADLLSNLATKGGKNIEAFLEAIGKGADAPYIKRAAKDALKRTETLRNEMNSNIGGARERMVVLERQALEETTNLSVARKAELDGFLAAEEAVEGDIDALANAFGKATRDLDVQEAAMRAELARIGAQAAKERQDWLVNAPRLRDGSLTDEAVHERLTALKRHEELQRQLKTIEEDREALANVAESVARRRVEAARLKSMASNDALLDAMAHGPVGVGPDFATGTGRRVDIPARTRYGTETDPASVMEMHGFVAHTDRNTMKMLQIAQNQRKILTAGHPEVDEFNREIDDTLAELSDAIDQSELIFNRDHQALEAATRAMTDVEDEARSLQFLKTRALGRPEKRDVLDDATSDLQQLTGPGGRLEEIKTHFNELAGPMMEQRRRIHTAQERLQTLRAQQIEAMRRSEVNAGRELLNDAEVEFIDGMWRDAAHDVMQSRHDYITAIRRERAVRNEIEAAQRANEMLPELEVQLVEAQARLDAANAQLIRRRDERLIAPSTEHVLGEPLLQVPDQPRLEGVAVAQEDVQHLASRVDDIRVMIAKHRKVQLTDGQLEHLEAVRETQEALKYHRRSAYRDDLDYFQAREQERNGARYAASPADQQRYDEAGDQVVEAWRSLDRAVLKTGQEWDLIARPLEQLERQRTGLDMGEAVFERQAAQQHLARVNSLRTEIEKAPGGKARFNAMRAEARARLNDVEELPGMQRYLQLTDEIATLRTKYDNALAAQHQASNDLTVLSEDRRFIAIEIEREMFNGGPKTKALKDAARRETTALTRIAERGDYYQAMIDRVPTVQRQAGLYGMTPEDVAKLREAYDVVAQGARAEAYGNQGYGRVFSQRELEKRGHDVAVARRTISEIRGRYEGKLSQTGEWMPGSTVPRAAGEPDPIGRVLPEQAQAEMRTLSERIRELSGNPAATDAERAELRASRDRLSELMATETGESAARVAADRIPESLDDLDALYREIVTGRKPMTTPRGKGKIIDKSWRKAGGATDVVSKAKQNVFLGHAKLNEVAPRLVEIGAVPQEAIDHANVLATSIYDSYTDGGLLVAYQKAPTQTNLDALENASNQLGRYIDVMFRYHALIDSGMQPSDRLGTLVAAKVAGEEHGALEKEAKKLIDELANPEEVRRHQKAQVKLRKQIENKIEVQKRRIERQEKRLLEEGRNDPRIIRDANKNINRLQLDLAGITPDYGPYTETIEAMVDMIEKQFEFYAKAHTEWTDARHFNRDFMHPADKLTQYKAESTYYSGKLEMTRAEDQRLEAAIIKAEEDGAESILYVPLDAEKLTLSAAEARDRMFQGAVPEYLAPELERKMTKAERVIAGNIRRRIDKGELPAEALITVSMPGGRKVAITPEYATWLVESGFLTPAETRRVTAEVTHSQQVLARTERITPKFEVDGVRYTVDEAREALRAGVIPEERRGLLQDWIERMGVDEMRAEQKGPAINVTEFKTGKATPMPLEEAKALLEWRQEGNYGSSEYTEKLIRQLDVKAAALDGSGVQRVNEIDNIIGTDAGELLPAEKTELLNERAELQTEIDHAIAASEADAQRIRDMTDGGDALVRSLVEGTEPLSPANINRMQSIGLTPTQVDLLTSLISGGRNALEQIRQATDPEEFDQIIADLLYLVDQDSQLAQFVRGAMNDAAMRRPRAGGQTDEVLAATFAEGTRGPDVQRMETDYGTPSNEAYLANDALDAYRQQIVVLAIQTANANRLEQGRITLDRLRILGFDINESAVMEKELARFGYVGERVRRDIIRDRVMEAADLKGLDVTGGYQARIKAIRTRQEQLKIVLRGLGNNINSKYAIKDPVKFWTIWNELGTREAGGVETRFADLLEQMIPAEATKQLDDYTKVLQGRMRAAIDAGDVAEQERIMAEAAQLRAGELPSAPVPEAEVIPEEVAPEAVAPTPEAVVEPAPEETPMVVPGAEVGPTLQEMEPGLAATYNTKLDRQTSIVQRLNTLEDEIASAQRRAAAPAPTGASPLDGLRDVAESPIRKPPQGKVTTAQWLLVKVEVDRAEAKVAAAAEGQALVDAKSALADAKNKLNEATFILWDNEPEEISRAAVDLYEQAKAGADTATLESVAPDSEAAVRLRQLTDERDALTKELGEVRAEIARIKGAPPDAEAAALVPDANVVGPAAAAPGPPEQQVAAAVATDAKARKPTVSDDAKVPLGVLVKRRDEELKRLQTLQANFKTAGARAEDTRSLAESAAKVRELTETINARRTAVNKQKMTADAFGNEILRTRAQADQAAAAPGEISFDWLAVLRGGVPVSRTKPRTLAGQVRGLAELRPLGQPLHGGGGPLNELVPNMQGVRTTRYLPQWAGEGPRARLGQLGRRRDPLTEAREQILAASQRNLTAAANEEGSVAERAARAALGPQVEQEMETARLAARAPDELFADAHSQMQANLVELQAERGGILPELEANRRAREQFEQEYNTALASENIALGEVRAEVASARAGFDQAEAKLKELKQMFTYDKRSKKGKLLKKAAVPENGLDGHRLITELENLLRDNPAGVDGVAETAALLDAAARQANNLQAAIDDADMYTRRLKEFEAASAEVSKVIKNLIADGWTPVAEKLLVGPHSVMMSKHLADVINSTIKTTADSRFWRALETYTSFFKTYAVMRPGFHVRNSMGGTFMNLVDGVRLRHIIEAPHIIRAWAKDPEAYLAAASPRIRQAFEAVWGSGATGQFMEEGVGRARAGAGVVTSRVLNNPATRLNARAGGYTEQAIRMAMALDSIDKGMDVMQALRRIRKYHFDYSQVSKLDRTARRIIPFWTFMSRNLPLQIEQMFLRPRVYLQYQSLVRNFGQPLDPATPEYWLAQSVWTLDENAEHRDAPWYLAPDLPHLKVTEPLDTLAQGNIGKALFSDLNPALLTPIESFVTGEDIYSGRSLEGYESPTLPMRALMPLLDMLGKTRETGSGEQVVDSGIANLMRGMIPPWDQIERYTNDQGVREGRQDETLLRALGVPVYQLNDALRQSTVRNRYYDLRDQTREMQDLARM